MDLNDIYDKEHSELENTNFDSQLDRRSDFRIATSETPRVCPVQVIDEKYMFSSNVREGERISAIVVKENTGWRIVDMKPIEIGCRLFDKYDRNNIEEDISDKKLVLSIEATITLFTNSIKTIETDYVGFQDVSIISASNTFPKAKKS